MADERDAVQAFRGRNVVSADDFSKAEILAAEVDSLQEAGPLDVLYMTRIQRERFPDPMDFERVRDAFQVDRAALEPLGPDLKVLHPLPRVNEVATDVDDLPGALYFRQTRNGVTVRMALLDMILGRRDEAR
jgi:aspartate carbamoyltransferase catalytic subunit